MLHKIFAQCPPLIAKDGCTVRELLHPKNDDVCLAYSLAHAEVAVGAASYRHRLKQQEVYYILAGRGRLHIDNDTTLVGPNEAIVIPARAIQWIENTGAEPLRFLAIVAPPWCAADDERLV